MKSTHKNEKKTGWVYQHLSESNIKNLDPVADEKNTKAIISRAFQDTHNIYGGKETKENKKASELLERSLKPVSKKLIGIMEKIKKDKNIYPINTKQRAITVVNMVLKQPEIAAFIKDTMSDVNIYLEHLQKSNEKWKNVDKAELADMLCRVAVTQVIMQACNKYNEKNKLPLKDFARLIRGVLCSKDDGKGMSTDEYLTQSADSLVGKLITVELDRLSKNEGSFYLQLLPDVLETQLPTRTETKLPHPTEVKGTLFSEKLPNEVNEAFKFIEEAAAENVMKDLEELIKNKDDQSYKMQKK